MSDSVAKFGVPAPDPASLADEARQLPDPRPYVALHEYGETIHVLRNKNMSWRAIVDWFAERGLEYSAQHFNNAYAKWLASIHVGDEG